MDFTKHIYRDKGPAMQEMVAMGRTNVHTISFAKLRNGYVVYQGDLLGYYDGTGLFVEDMDGVLRETAVIIGGPDAVPMTPVSAEEAGLMPSDTLNLTTDASTLVCAIYDSVERIKIYSGRLGVKPSSVSLEIDNIFKQLGYADYQDYVGGDAQPIDVLQRILGALQMRIEERTAEITRRSN